MIGSLHAVAMTYSNLARLESFVMALDILVRSDLQRGFFRGAKPLPEWRVHARRVLELTLLRHRSTAARIPGEDNAQRRRRKSDTDELVELLLDLLNGNWCLGFLQHYCWRLGCCDGGSLKVTHVHPPPTRTSLGWRGVPDFSALPRFSHWT
jgi:hypothetical protein